MFNEGVNFRRKVRIDFKDHRKRVTAKGLAGLGQGEDVAMESFYLVPQDTKVPQDTGIQELQYQAPLAIAPVAPPPSYGDMTGSIIAAGAQEAWAPTPVVQAQPSLLQSLLGLGNTYLQVQKTRAVASSQQRLAAALKPSTTRVGSSIFPGGISSTTIFMGTVLLIGGYLIISSMSRGNSKEL